jgi:acyl-CoA dehydrogenase
VAERIDVIAPHPLGRLEFKDCVIPAGNLIGQPGEGFKIAMSNLDVFRSTVGAAALGFARRALDEALKRVHERKVFDQKLADYQLTQAKIADMATEIDASALLIYRAAWTKDQGAARVTREASMAKMYATEAAQRVIDAAVQLWGGLGVTRGVMVESLYREVRALRIYEGTTEVNKLVIAGQTYAAYAAEGRE